MFLTVLFHRLADLHRKFHPRLLAIPLHCHLGEIRPGSRTLLGLHVVVLEIRRVIFILSGFQLDQFALEIEEVARREPVKPPVDGGRFVGVPRDEGRERRVAIDVVFSRVSQLDRLHSLLEMLLLAPQSHGGDREERELSIYVAHSFLSSEVEATQPPPRRRGAVRHLGLCTLKTKPDL